MSRIARGKLRHLVIHNEDAAVHRNGRNVA
jgi:hypothetical protein